MAYLLTFSRWLKDLKDLITQRGWVALAGVALALAMSVPAWAQMDLDNIALATQVVEPSKGATQVVFKVKFSDLDTVPDDADGIVVKCILVQNLGTATATDITHVVLQGAGVQTPSWQMTETPPLATPADCPDGSANATNVAFEAFFDKAALDASGFGGAPKDIADDGSLNLDIAVRVNNSDALGNGAQGHTLKLRVLVLFEEKVGSPAQLTEFTDSITDAEQDQVNNGGINELTTVNFTAHTIRIGEEGVVGSFMVCDNDANTLPLILTNLILVQGDFGDALNSDIEEINLIRVGVGKVGTITPASDGSGADLNRSGVGMVMSVNVQIPEDQCEIFQLKAAVAATAQRGRRIQLNLEFLTREGEVISDSVAPVLQMVQSVLIGSGIISIPDTQISDGAIPIQISDFPLPGLGSLSVQTQSVQFDPSVFKVLNVKSQTPYQVMGLKIDNRAGLLKFILKVDQTQTGSAKTNGTIGYINVERVGESGQSSLFLFVVDDVRDADNNNLTAGIVVTSGFVEVLTPGDVDFDTFVTVRDALIVATAILPCTSSVPNIASLSDEQKKSADVAPNQASGGNVPTCVELNSADVRGIARLSILFGISSADTGVMPAAVVPKKELSWWDKLLQPVLGVFGLIKLPAEATLMADTNTNTVTLNLDTERAVGAVQGRVTFDPDAVQVDSIFGMNGHEVMAVEIDNTKGEVYFATVASDQSGRGAVIGLNLSNSDSSSLNLQLDYVFDHKADAIPHVITHTASATPTPLKVSNLVLSTSSSLQWQLGVSGLGVESVMIQGFDLSGRIRFESQNQGNQLSWSMLDKQGRPLANGVYLYVVTVMGQDNSVWRSQVRKLALLR
jgi:hypothetical protein